MVHISSIDSFPDRTASRRGFCWRVRLFRSQLEAFWQAWLPVAVVVGMILLIFRI
jgi:hypothetical protein